MKREADAAKSPRFIFFIRRMSVLNRELNTIVVGLSLATTAFIILRWSFPRLADDGMIPFFEKFVGVSWPFFALVSAFLFYILGASVVEAFALGMPRRWQGIGHILHWATEACPLVGLLTTFLSLLTALLAYGAAGLGNPGTQATFITQFAIAFGSSIAGGVLALMAFTLHRLLPVED